ncbi:TPA: hypothetical protein ACH3X3_010529 [Trebouxia sp. C0006]
MSAITGIVTIKQGNSGAPPPSPPPHGQTLFMGRLCPQATRQQLCSSRPPPVGSEPAQRLHSCHNCPGGCSCTIVHERCLRQAFCINWSAPQLTSSQEAPSSSQSLAAPLQPGAGTVCRWPDWARLPNPSA